MSISDRDLEEIERMNKDARDLLIQKRDRTDKTIRELEEEVRQLRKALETIVRWYETEEDVKTAALGMYDVARETLSGDAKNNPAEAGPV